MKSLEQVVAEKMDELKEVSGGTSKLEEISESWRGRRVSMEKKALDLEDAIANAKRVTVTSAQCLVESVKAAFGVDDRAAKLFAEEDGQGGCISEQVRRELLTETLPAPAAEKGHVRHDAIRNAILLQE